MANNKTDDNTQTLSEYASRHPRRMWSGAFLVGTALGVSLMAAKKNHDKNALQKLIDNISR